MQKVLLMGSLYRFRGGVFYRVEFFVCPPKKKDTHAYAHVYEMKKKKRALAASNPDHQGRDIVSFFFVLHSLLPRHAEMSPRDSNLRMASLAALPPPHARAIDATNMLHSGRGV